VVEATEHARAKVDAVGGIGEQSEKGGGQASSALRRGVVPTSSGGLAEVLATVMCGGST